VDLVAVFSIDPFHFNSKVYIFIYMDERVYRVILVF